MTNGKQILMTTIMELPDYKIVKTLGLVKGNSVRARNVGRDIQAGLKNIIGGEITQYTELLQQSRDEAVGRMLAEARAMGANAVIGVRFTTAEVMTGTAELLAYGTAVIIE